MLFRVRRRLSRILRRPVDSTHVVTREAYAAIADHAAIATLAALPGARDLGLPEPSDAMRTEAAEIVAHRFDLLGSGRVELVAGESAEWRQRFAELTAEIAPAITSRYKPIEWHTDWRSGYRWDPDSGYREVRVAPRPAVDIKLPRELSRFQHVGVLAHAGRPEHHTEFLLQVLDWIAANPVGFGVNWASAMDVAIRAVNWIWGLRLFDRTLRSHPAAASEIRRSLYEHGRFLESNLEYYEERTNNHYLADVAGLIHIGAACPELPESDRWLHLGLQELVSEMWRTVYCDGGSYEGSSYYHRLVAEMFASCAALAERIPPARRARLARLEFASYRQRPPLRELRAFGIRLQGDTHRLLPDEFYARLARMGEFTAALTKPNGFVPEMGDNDSARLHKLSSKATEDVRDHRHLVALIGALTGRDDLTHVAATSPSALAEAELMTRGIPAAAAIPPNAALAEPMIVFPASGVAVLRAGDAWVAITCGPNGQHGRGGHNHNDKGSVELNVRSADVVVDGGCAVYTAEPDARNQFRSTPAHSTLWMEGVEQDQWPEGPTGLFELPQRSSPSLVREGDAIVTLHHGFAAPHRRRVHLLVDELRIEDELGAVGPLFAGFNLHPDVKVSIEHSESGWRARCSTNAAELLFAFDALATLRIEEGFFSPAYGVRIPSTRLVGRLAGQRLTTRITWAH